MTAPTATKNRHPLRKMAAVVGVAAAVTGVVTRCPGPAPLDREGSKVELVTAATYGTVDGDGEFRTNCQRAHYNNDDRIVYPDRAGAAHKHMYFGADGVDFDTDPIDSEGSTCEGGILNKTGYWVPAMLDGDGKVIDAANARDAIQVYYKLGYRGITGRMVKPFPEGLRMIAGDSKGSALTDTTKVWWTCQPNLTIQQGIPHQATIPESCTGYVQAAIEFPQCWNGRDLDSPDHKSHMAYGLGWPDRGCPGSHPVALPQITEFIRWPANGNTSDWHISSDLEGAPGGSSLHADWFNGWQPETMEKIVNNCLVPEIDCRMNLLGDGTMLTWDPNLGASRRGDAPTGSTTVPPVTTTTTPN